MAGSILFQDATSYPVGPPELCLSLSQEQLRGLLCHLI